jgi:hypothetical protein
MNDKGSLTNAVLVPGLQALITAVLVGGLALVVCSLLRWPWQLAAVLTLSVLLARWLSLSGWWSDLVARILAPDLVIEPERIPPGEPQTINIHLSRETEGGYLEGAFIEAPVTDDELRLLAGGVIEGRSLTTSQWAYQIGWRTHPPPGAVIGALMAGNDCTRRLHTERPAVTSFLTVLANQPAISPYMTRDDLLCYASKLECLSCIP